TTTEVRDSAGQRVGFDIVTVEGKRQELARVGFRSRARVGRYGVNLEAFERLALPELARRDVDLIVVDEIGKMECSSGRFRRAVEDVLDSPVSALRSEERRVGKECRCRWSRDQWKKDRRGS